MARKSFDHNLVEQYEAAAAGEMDAYLQQLEQSMGQPGQQSTAPAEEQAARKAAMRTQGRKGCKATRINMAFTPENYQFVKICSRAAGMSITEFSNAIIESYRNEHQDFYEQCRGVLNAAEQFRAGLASAAPDSLAGADLDADQNGGADDPAAGEEGEYYDDNENWNT